MRGVLLGAVLGALCTAACLAGLRGRALVPVLDVHTAVAVAWRMAPGRSSVAPVQHPPLPCPTPPSGRSAAVLASTQKAASPAPLPAYLQDLLPVPWRPLLTEEEVGRAEAYYGGGAALRRVAAKLLAGQPITLVLLGGSVTAGVGRGEGPAYTHAFFRMINASFPHSGHVLLTRGIGGTGSGIFAACLERMVPRDADLAVVEFTINEPTSASYDTPERRGYEQLLRKLLALRAHGGSSDSGGIDGGSSGSRHGDSPSDRLPPAVLLLHFYSWWKPAYDGQLPGSFFHTNEAQLNTFANYYDLPAVSIRNGMWRLMQAGIEGFKVDHVTAAKTQDPERRGFTEYGLGWAPPEQEADYLLFDAMHPNAHGHLAMAEALAGPLRRALSEAAAAQARAGYGHSSSSSSSSGSSSSSSGSSSSGTGTSSGMPQRRDPGLQDLPPPMLPGNWESPALLCAMQEGFRTVVKRSSKGFLYLAERPDAPSFAEQKWGWTATRPGEWVELEFDSRVAPDAAGSSLPTAADAAGGVLEGPATGNATATAWLIYLKSYEHMGTARAACVAGCLCRMRQLDGTWRQRFSLNQILELEVTQHQQCVVRITVNRRPGLFPSGEHKVSLTGALVTPFPLALNGMANNVDRAAGFAAAGR